MPTSLSHNGRMVLTRPDGSEVRIAVFVFREERTLWWKHGGTWDRIGLVDEPRRMVHVRAFGAPPHLFELAKQTTHPRRHGCTIRVDRPHCRRCGEELVRDQDVREGKHVGCL